MTLHHIKDKAHTVSMAYEAPHEIFPTHISYFSPQPSLFDLKSPIRFNCFYLLHCPIFKMSMWNFHQEHSAHGQTFNIPTYYSLDLNFDILFSQKLFWLQSKLDA